MGGKDEVLKVFGDAPSSVRRPSHQRAGVHSGGQGPGVSRDRVQRPLGIPRVISVAQAAVNLVIEPLELPSELVRFPAQAGAHQAIDAIPRGVYRRKT